LQRIVYSCCYGIGELVSAMVPMICFWILERAARVANKKASRKKGLF